MNLIAKFLFILENDIPLYHFFSSSYFKMECALDPKLPWLGTF
jgi:hypothetical protein